MNQADTKNQCKDHTIIGHYVYICRYKTASSPQDNRGRCLILCVSVLVQSNKHLQQEEKFTSNATWEIYGSLSRGLTFTGHLLVGFNKQQLHFDK